MSDLKTVEGSKTTLPISEIEEIKVNPILDSIDINDFHIKNVMEPIVLEKMESILHLIGDCCACNKCKSDIIAITLNNMPSKYVVTRQGELYSRIGATEIQNSTKISAIITSAVLYVRDHPRH